jgi:hypothetical protein
MKTIVALLALIVVAILVFIYWRKTRNDMGEYHPPGKLERKIAARIDSCQSSRPCTFRLSELTDFAWDRVYDFPAGTSRSQIESILHTPFRYEVDTAPWMVFVNDGRVVYAEEEAWHVEKPAVNGVTFDSRAAQPETSYANDVQFIGSREPFAGGYLYSMKTVR